MIITCIDLEMMNKTVEVLKKQGFNMITMSQYGHNDSDEFLTFCTYGKTEETYNVRVNPWQGIITKTTRVN